MADRESDPTPLEIAQRIADGTPVSWPDGAAADARPESLLEQLRVVERIAHAFRQEPPAIADPAEERSLFAWGRLEVRELIGEGSFGEVYRAYDPLLDREVALKLRKGDVDARGQGMRRALEEARRLARIRHLNVVTVHGAEIADGRFGLWTDLVDGQTLRALVEERGPLGAAEATAVGIDLCRALAAVHAADVVHGDLTASNVMRERGGRILLVDFGAGSSMAAGQGDRPLAGTMVAMAPELLGGARLTCRSDVYGVGSVLCFLLTGGYPVSGTSLTEVVKAHREAAMPPLRGRRPDLPPALVAVVERALAPRPEDRFASAGEMERALALAAGVAPAPAGAPRRGDRPVPWVLAAASVALVGLALSALWWSAHRRDAVDRAAAGAAVQGQRIVSTFPGDHEAPAFSPDGEMLAFVSDASGTPQIWVKTVGRGDPLAITSGPRAAADPSWAADELIVFALEGQGIWAVPPLGGEPRQIVQDGYNPHASNGRIVFERDRGLWIVDGHGQAPPLRITTVPRRMYEPVAAEPALSPDGTRVVYFHQEDGPLGDLWVVDLDGKPPRRLTSDRAEGGAPAWTPDGRQVVFWSNRSGSRTLWRIAAAGGSPEPLTTGAGEDGDPAFAPDGRSIVFSNTRNRWRLVALEPASGRKRVLLDRRFGIYLPDLSPDGARIAFSHHVGRAVHLFTIGVDGAGLRQVTEGEDAVNIHPRWSADGESLVYYRFPDPGLHRIPAVGGHSEAIAPGWTWERESAAQPDPTGTKIAYLLRDQDRETTLVWDRQSGRTTALPAPHLHGIAWLPGAEAVVGWTHEATIARCALDGPRCTVLTEGTEPVVAAAEERIYFQRPGRHPSLRELWSMDLTGGDLRHLGAIGPLHYLGLNFDVTPAGEVLFIEYLEGRKELWRLTLGGPLDGADPRGGETVSRR